MPDNSALIKRLQEQDSNALSLVYEQYSGAIYGVILRICKNEAMAEDLLQETFLKIWQNAASYNPEKGKFFTWAYRIAKNLSLNALRKKNDLIQNQDLGVYENKGEVVINIDCSELKGSIKKLELHHQKALRLVYFEGFTHREAHEKMNVPLGTFKSYIQQALKKLRETYQKEHFLLWICLDKVYNG